MVAMLRGASDRPWRQAMLQGIGMGLLIGGERGRPCMDPEERPVICRVEVEDQIEDDPFKVRTILMRKNRRHKRG